MIRQLKPKICRLLVQRENQSRVFKLETMTINEEEGMKRSGWVVVRKGKTKFIADFAGNSTINTESQEIEATKLDSP